MNNLCEKCGKNPWAAPVFLGSKPTEQWCDDCIHAEIETKGFINVLGNYFESKNQREVIALIEDLETCLVNECISYTDYYLEETGQYEESCGYARDRLSQVAKIKSKLTEMWGEW